VSFELSSRPAEAEITFFMPADSVLSIVQRIIASCADSRITLPGKGGVVIFPGLGEYYANVRDMAEFCQAPATQFEITGWNETTPPSHLGIAKNIRDLLWQTAFHSSRGRLVEGRSKYDVVQFRHWPNVTRLPVSPNTVRICALLTRHPTTIMFVHRLLGISKEEVYQNYSAAVSAGIANVISSHSEATVFKPDEIEAQPEPVQHRGLFRSLFAKISGL